MPPKIKNRENILSHGDIASRKIVLDIAEQTLQRLDAYHRIKSIARMEGSVLSIGQKSWDLSRKRHVYLLGAGKACNHMARALDEILGDYLTRGIIIVKILEEEDVYGRTDDGYALAHQNITRTLLIADDLTVSNKQRIIRANQAGSIDGFILKPNQIGTITEALEAHYAAEHDLLSITSGRSGGVLNDIVMDLAVGLQLPFINNGCPRSGERIEKLNFLLRVCDRFGCSISQWSRGLPARPGDQPGRNQSVPKGWHPLRKPLLQS